MNNNQSTPNIDPNAKTRQIPVQKPAAKSDASATRQIPVQRPTTYQNGQVRQIPVQKPAAHSTNADATRQIPVQKPAAHSVNADATRQIPVQKPAVHSANADATRQIPVQKPAAHSANADATRQIPVQKPAAHSVNADATRQIPVQKPAAHFVNADATRQIPVQKPAAHSANADATKQIPITDGAIQDISNKKTENDGTAYEKAHEKKKKHISLFGDKGNDDDNTALISIIKAVVYIVAVLVISVSASIFIILVGNDVFALVKSEEVVEITIPEGADIGDVASVLADSNVIKYPRIFKWYANHNEDDGKFIPGKYSIASNLDYDDLLLAFKEQHDEGTSWVTIPEGYTTDEIIDLMVETGIGTKEGYIEVINNYDFDYWFVDELDKTDWKSEGRIYRLDGYLFPDTYEFYNESSERAVIEKLLARFNVIFGKKYREAAETMEMSVDDIVTIASMIEKEAGKAADYHLVSSVFHNRLQSQYFPKMESDATALYAIHHDTGERPTDVTGEHMRYDSPYNTYLYDGLPPGPIANPSASSINAALTPEDTNYYYFVSHGIDTYFGRTNDEHERNKAMIAQLKSQASGNTQE